MAQPAMLIAGLLFIAASQASDVVDRSTHQGFLSRYMRFVTKYTNANGKQKASHQRFTSARAESSITTKDFDPPKISDKEENQVVQKLFADASYKPITLTAIGVGLLSLVTMLGVRMRRHLQPATALASSGGPINTASAQGDKIMEMKSQDSSVNSGAASPPLTVCYATNASVARGGGGFGIAAAWGALGMFAILANAIRRVLPVALEPFADGAVSLAPQIWAAYAAFVIFMAYVEGYKAFHLKFSPMVVARALTLRDAPLLHVLFAPFYSMGLFHASRKRLYTSWGFVVGIAAIVALVKRLVYPWRSVVDGGVVAGLSVGAASILYHYVRSFAGVDPPADPALP
jgi:hypothetical protein